jgi:hypothetical protein
MIQTPERLQAIRKTVTTFASLFKDIPFVRYDDQGKEIERIKVPIVYGNKEKYIKRLETIDEKIQITLPRIEYGLINIQYDPSRRTNQANKILGCSATGSVYVNSPTPYNFNFELVLYTRNIEDANQIIEYILPHFYPDFNIKINFVPDAGISKNVPFTFQGESQDEDSTGSFDSSVRSVFRTLNFVARSYIFPPTRNVVPILQAETNIYIQTSNREFNISNGAGYFLKGDYVFQGISLDRASAKGTVEYFNANTGTLYLSDIKGEFKSNTIIYNTFKTAYFTLNTIPNDNLAINSVITPVPNTYPVTGPYEYNIILNDYTS